MNNTAYLNLERLIGKVSKNIKIGMSANPVRVVFLLQKYSISAYLHMKRTRKELKRILNIT